MRWHKLGADELRPAVQSGLPSVQEVEWVYSFSMAEKNQKMNTILSDVKLILNASFSIQE